MRADGCDLRSIRQPEDLDNGHPDWSPNGRSIVSMSGMKDSSFLQVFHLA
jgi:hypothetical protein